MQIADISPKVIIAAEHQEAANLDLPGTFIGGYSADGTAPATHYLANGWWEPEEINKIVSGGFVWPCVIKFGPMESVLAELELMPVQPEDISS